MSGSRQRYNATGKGRVAKASGGSGLSTLSTLMLGLGFISLVIFLVAPHDKSYAEESKALLQRGQQLESEAIHMLFDNGYPTHLRGTDGEEGQREGNELEHQHQNEHPASSVETKDTTMTAGKNAPPNNIDDIRKLARHKNAYVTLMSGIDESRKYRGFLYNDDYEEGA